MSQEVIEFVIVCSLRTFLLLRENFFFAVTENSRQVSFFSVVTFSRHSSGLIFLSAAGVFHGLVLFTHNLVKVVLLTGLFVISIPCRKVFLVVYTWCIY